MGKSLDDYKIPGTNCVNWTAYSRENIPKPPPKFKVGDKVRFTLETEITRIGTDCDGTTLYEASMIGFGWDEDTFTLMEPSDDPR